MSCLIGGMNNDKPADNEVHEILGKVSSIVIDKILLNLCEL